MCPQKVYPLQIWLALTRNHHQKFWHPSRAPNTGIWATGSSAVIEAVQAPLDGKADFRRAELLSGGEFLLALMMEGTLLLSSGYPGGS